MAVSADDSPNDPKYRLLRARAGEVYRVRAYPGENVRSILAVVVDPSGKPIRRALTGTGELINPPTVFSILNLADLEAEQRDCESFCKGDRHVDILFRTLVAGDYKVGVCQVTDAKYERADFPAGDAGDHQCTIEFYSMGMQGEEGGDGMGARIAGG